MPSAWVLLISAPGCTHRVLTDGQISPRNAADRKRIFDDRVDITTRAFILATITTRRPNSGGDMPKRDQYASASAAPGRRMAGACAV